MSTVIVTAGSIVLALSVTISVASAVLFSKSNRNLLAHCDRSHARMVAMHEDLLDRVMAGDFALFKSNQLAERSGEEGGWEPPPDRHLKPVEDSEAYKS